MIQKIDAPACYLVTKKGIFLARKKRKVAKGLYMPYGGRREAGETFEEAAIRELREESGVSCEIDDLEKVGILTVARFTPRGVQVSIWTVPIYFVHGYSGVPVETEEMGPPEFFRRGKQYLPLAEMSEGDRVLLPKVLAGSYIHAYARCNENMTLLSPLKISLEYKRLTRRR